MLCGDTMLSRLLPKLTALLGADDYDDDDDDDDNEMSTSMVSGMIPVISLTAMLTAKGFTTVMTLIMVMMN